jgi:hypothetical protein
LFQRLAFWFLSCAAASKKASGERASKRMELQGKRLMKRERRNPSIRIRPWVPSFLSGASLMAEALRRARNGRTARNRRTAGGRRQAANAKIGSAWTPRKTASWRIFFAAERGSDLDHGQTGWRRARELDRPAKKTASAIKPPKYRLVASRYGANVLFARKRKVKPMTADAAR